MTVPAGYTGLARGARRALIRNDLVAALGPWLLRTPLGPPPNATSLAGGRGATYRVTLERGGAIVRFGRRGGIIGRVLRSWYAGLHPRPWRELRVSLAARERGAPVPEVLAACVHGWGVYRSAVVTDEIPGVTTAIEALHAVAAGSPRLAIARAAGIAVARLHAAGVVHVDLNLTNVLVGGAGAFVVDLDRARVRVEALGRWERRRSLRRLARSARKLDPRCEVVDGTLCRTFEHAYAGRGVEGTCEP